MTDKNYINNLFGGIDSRKNYTSSEGNIIYWDSAKNVYIDGKTIKRCKGQTQKLTNSPGSYICLGLGEFEKNGIFYSRAVFSDGKYYHYNETTGYLSTAKKIGLSTISKPYFFQYKDKLCVITGRNDPFLDNGLTITQTTLYNEKSVYGTCGSEYAGRVFIGSGSGLYGSANGDPTDYTTSEDAFYDGNYHGDIKNLLKLGDYLMVYTTQNIYTFSGYDWQTFQKTHFSDVGIAGAYNVCKFQDKHFVFTLNGLFELSQLSEMAQFNAKNSLSYRVHEEIMGELDKNRLAEVELVPYSDKQQIWIYIPLKNESNIYKCWIADFQNYYDSKIIAFYPREANAVTCAASLKGKIYSGTSSGKIYREDYGETFDGIVIDSEIKITFTLGDDSKNKYVDIMKLLHSNEEYNNYTLERSYNGKYWQASDKDITVSTPYYVLGIDAIGTKPLGDGSDRLSKIIPLNKRFESCKLNFKTDTTLQNFQIHGVSFVNAKLLEAV